MSNTDETDTMQKLPEKFDNLVDLNNYIAKQVDPDGDRSVLNPQYCTFQEDALGLLMDFCEERDLQPQIERDWVGIYGIWGGDIEMAVGEDFDKEYKIDPVALSVVVYRTYEKLKD